MTLYYFVVSGKGDDFVVHSKHRKKEAAEKKLTSKVRLFRAAGIEREARIIEEYWYKDLCVPHVLRAKAEGLK
jgi:hypothetical protein